MRKAWRPVQLTIEVSPQALSVLRELRDRGLWGVTVERVAEGLVYERLRELVVTPAVRLARPRRRSRRRRRSP